MNERCISSVKSFLDGLFFWVDGLIKFINLMIIKLVFFIPMNFYSNF